MEDVIDLTRNLDRLGDVVFDKFKPGVVDEAGDVAASTRQQIVDANDFVAVLEKPFAKVRSDKPCAAGDDRSQRPCSSVDDWGDQPIPLAGS